MNNPLVSVIIPNYNHAKYLDQRIQSVLNQTYQNFEVIILDDCSPDNGASKAVIEQYRENPHVSHIVYNEVNSGSTFKQWHKGFDLAKGDWIWIAESDDYCETNFLETLYPYLNGENVVVLSESIHIDTKGNPMEKFKEKYRVEKIGGIEFIKKRIIYSNNHIPNASAVLFRKDIALAIDRSYMDYKASGDRLFWIKMLESGHITKVFKPLNYFRQHNNKVSPRAEVTGVQCSENYKINKYLHSKGYVKGIVWITEFVEYWKYINNYNFENEEIRSYLKNTWFSNKLLYNKVTFRFSWYFLRIYRSIIGL